MRRPILRAMEKTQTIPSLAAQATKHPVPTNKLEQRLFSERLRVLAEQSGAEFAMAALVLLGYLVLFANQLDFYWLLCGAPILAVYLFRLWIAQHFLQRYKQQKLYLWFKLFVLISVLCGISWGIFVSMLILRGSPDTVAYITFLIGGLTVAAILTLGALLSAYIGYTLGILIPIATSLLIRDHGIDSGLAGVILLYALFLLFTVTNFHQRLNTWLRLANENAELANRLDDLYDERRHYDRAWSELEGRLEQMLKYIQ